MTRSKVVATEDFAGDWKNSPPPTDIEAEVLGVSCEVVVSA